MDIVSHEKILWHNGGTQSETENCVCVCVYGHVCVSNRESMIAVQTLQWCQGWIWHSQQWRLKYYDFLFEITQEKCGSTGNRAMSQGKKKQLYSAGYSMFQSTPVLVWQTLLKSTAGLFKGSFTFVPRGKKTVLDRNCRKVICAKCSSEAVAHYDTHLSSTYVYIRVKVLYCMLSHRKTNCRKSQLRLEWRNYYRNTFMGKWFCLK